MSASVSSGHNLLAGYAVLPVDVDFVAENRARRGTRESSAPARAPERRRGREGVSAEVPQRRDEVAITRTTRSPG